MHLRSRENSVRQYRRTTILMIVIVCCSTIVCAQEVADTAELASEDHYVFSPFPSQEWKLRGSLGLSLAILPQPLTEYPTPAPMLDIRYRFSMPLNCSVYGRLGSNIATSIVQAGGLFSLPVADLTIGAGWSVMFVYGNITYVDGFNTTQQRWINYPMVTASYRFPKATLTARIEAELTTSVESSLEDQTVVDDQDLRSGASATLALEQPFFGRTHVIIGATFQLSNQPYQAWFLYNTFSDRLFSSEFFMGIIL